MSAPGRMLAASVIALGLCACGGSSASPRHGITEEGGLGGGDDGGVPSFTGVTPCGTAVDAGSLAQAECALTMPVSGGLSETIHVPNVLIVCGSGSDATGIGSVDFETNTGDGTSVSASITFESSVPYDTAGTFPAHVGVATTAGDGASMQWQTPAAACNIVIAGSVCLTLPPSDADGGTTRTKRVLSGTGSCSQPAAPQSGNTGQPVDVGSFQFLSAVGP